MTALLNKEQVCERLQISRRTLDRLIAERRIAYRKLGSAVRFAEDDVQQYVDGVVVHVAPPAGRNRLRGLA